MKILALRADEGGCAKYRIIEPIRAVTEQYPDIFETRVSTHVSVDATQDVRTKIYTVHEVKEDVDLIVIQRPLNNYGVSLIEQARRQGIATIVEIDDDFDSVHRKNSAYEKIRADIHPHENGTWLRKACALADLVTVSTPNLTKYAPHGRVRIIPNTIPERVFNLVKRPNHQGTTIGWTGDVATHPEDLPVTGGAVRTVTARTGARLAVVGNGKKVREQLGFTRDYPMLVTGFTDPETYYQWVLDTIDIGIVPLEDSEFNRSKSNLKLMEFSALGVPAVASPTPENLYLNSLGVGLIAHTPDEWKKHLTALVKNPRKRNQLGRKSREIIQENFTTEQNAYKWAQAYLDAVDIHNARVSEALKEVKI